MVVAVAVAVSREGVEEVREDERQCEEERSCDNITCGDMLLGGRAEVREVITERHGLLKRH